VPLVVLLLVASSRAAADDSPVETRAPPPDPAKGEPYDGRGPQPSVGRGFLWVPRVILFPFRLLFWGIELPTRPLVEFEQRHHIYGHLYWASTSADGQIGVRPTFYWISSFKPSFGLHFFDDKLFGPSTRATLDASGFADVVNLALHLRPTHLGRPLQGYFDAIYDRRNDLLFTGIGSAAPLPPNSRARYQQDLFDVGGRFGLQPTDIIGFTFGGFFGLRRFGNGESYSGDPPIDQVYCVMVGGVCVPGTVSDALVPGFNQGTQFLRTSAALHLDLRDNRIRPTVGMLFNAEADYTHGVGNDDDSSYFRVWGSLAVDINLWRHSHVLVVRGATELVLPLGNTIVPFSELAVLGGPNDLRGFLWQEFRDYSSLVMTVEYRWPLLGWVEGGLFVDYGGVYGQKYQGFGASQMQEDIGFSVRLHTWDRFYVKMQFAYGFDGGGWHIYLSGQNLP
jgi:hypothetical protein